MDHVRRCVPAHLGNRPGHGKDVGRGELPVVADSHLGHAVAIEGHVEGRIGQRVLVAPPGRATVHEGEPQRLARQRRDPDQGQVGRIDLEQAVRNRSDDPSPAGRRDRDETADVADGRGSEDLTRLAVDQPEDAPVGFGQEPVTAHDPQSADRGVHRPDRGRGHHRGPSAGRLVERRARDCEDPPRGSARVEAIGLSVEGNGLGAGGGHLEPR